MRRLVQLVVIVVIAGCGASPDPAGGVDGSMSGDGSMPGNDTRLNPLAVDRAWTYDVVSTYASCPAGVHEQRVTGTGSIDGRSTFKIASFCGSVGESFVDGDLVEDHYDWGPVGWTRQLDVPVMDGHTWTTTNGSATFTETYSDVGAFAGHDDCWKVTQNVSYTSYWIYCRGVGLVKYEIIDLGGGTIRAELQSKSF